MAHPQAGTAHRWPGMHSSWRQALKGPNHPPSQESVPATTYAPCHQDYHLEGAPRNFRTHGQRTQCTYSAHVLYDTDDHGPPQPIDTSAAGSFRRCWRHVQYLVDKFWSHWIREYLPSLRVRHRAFKKCRNFQVGDLVLITGEQTPS